MNIDEIIKKIIKVSGRYWYKQLTDEELEIISSKTNFLPKSADIKKRRIYFINKLDKIQRCPVCGEEVLWDRKHQKFPKRCSKNCFLVPDNVSLNEILNYTSFLPEDIDFKERIGYFKLQENTIRTCKTCGLMVKYDSRHLTFPNYCNKECRVADKENINIKRKDTWDKKTQKEKASIKEKRTNTNIENWGTENVFQNSEIKEKSKNSRKHTIQEEYGVDYYPQTDEFKEKSKKTSMENWGKPNPMQSDTVKNKQRDSLEKNLGVRNPMQSKLIQDEVKQTTLEKYGVDYFFQSEVFKDSSVKTLNEKYGVDHYSETDEFKKNSTRTQRLNYYPIFIEKLSIKRITPMFNQEFYIECQHDEKKEYKCNRCNNTFISTQTKVQNVYCPSCINNRSQAESDIREWLISENGYLEILSNQRFRFEGRTMELDLYIPSKNIGIEYHGLYWHSDTHKDKNYHLDKYNFFKKQDITVIQIFENEWKYNKEVVKSIILSKLALTKRKHYARKCVIKNIENDEYREFCNNNHIQGYGMAKVKIGLYSNNELVQVLSFSKSRFNKHYDWENVRSCTKTNNIVIGGFSKMFKYFRKNYKGSIITYVDVRYFNGNSYEKVGFELLRHSNPNYFYFYNKSDILESRQKYQKHKLESKLEIFDPNRTEIQNMSDNGYSRIFDAGNLVFGISQ